MRYDQITGLELECKCSDISEMEWERLMVGAVIADKKKIDNLVRCFLPELYDALGLDHYNPYKYQRTKRHLILVHSGIEYFLKYYF